jgi:hypothetical protein
LCSMSFDRDRGKPTRLDGEAEACSDDIALNMDRDTGAILALTGSSIPGEGEGKYATSKLQPGVTVGAQRAVNAWRDLVGRKGIDPSRILVYTGSDQSKSVDASLLTVENKDALGCLKPVDPRRVRGMDYYCSEPDGWKCIDRATGKWQ